MDVLKLLEMMENACPVKCNVSVVFKLPELIQLKWFMVVKNKRKRGTKLDFYGYIRIDNATEAAYKREISILRMMMIRDIKKINPDLVNN